MTAERNGSGEQERGQRPGLVRMVLVAAFVLFIGGLILRTALVRRLSDDRPETAARVWNAHPEVLKALALTMVAQAAARGQAPPAALERDLGRLTDRAPLDPTPFLIEGTIASRAGDYKRAQALLALAVRRDPRSVAARFILADSYLQVNALVPALEQLGVLARLSPSFAQSLVPALARYAKTPGALPAVRRVMINNPGLANQLLAELATDPGNANLILGLAQNVPSLGEMQPWQQTLLSALVNAGNYESAYALWHRFDRSGASAPEFAFQEQKHPSPFTWTFANQGDAAAEPSSGGLRVTFSGNSTVVLASKIARLQPGNYAMQFRASHTSGAVWWKVTCLPSNEVLVNQSLAPSSGQEFQAHFPVGAGCRAERFELIGEAQTNPSPAEFTIDAYQVKRI